LHGANRLASNSLLEALVFGRKVAMTANEAPPLPPLPSHLTVPIETGHTRMVEEEWIESQILRLRTMMWDHVGIVRTNEGLEKARREIEVIREEAEARFRHGRLAGRLVELRNLTTVAWLIVVCALNRHESRGLHFNLDYPQHDDENWRKDIILVKDRVMLEEVRD